MIRGFVLLLVVGMLFSASGCKMCEMMAVKQDGPIRYEAKPNLSAKENHALKGWSHAATMADDVGDNDTAILYYIKIADFFPDTKEGKKAQKRLDEICPKSSEAEESNSCNAFKRR